MRNPQPSLGKQPAENCERRRPTSACLTRKEEALCEETVGVVSSIVYLMCVCVCAEPLYVCAGVYAHARDVWREPRLLLRMPFCPSIPGIRASPPWLLSSTPFIPPHPLPPFNSFRHVLSPISPLPSCVIRRRTCFFLGFFPNRPKTGR